jgi:hypothetical protein
MRYTAPSVTAAPSNCSGVSRSPRKMYLRNARGDRAELEGSSAESLAGCSVPAMQKPPGDCPLLRQSQLESTHSLGTRWGHYRQHLESLEASTGKQLLRYSCISLKQQRRVAKVAGAPINACHLPENMPCCPAKQPAPCHQDPSVPYPWHSIPWHPPPLPLPATHPLPAANMGVRKVRELRAVRLPLEAL